MTDPNNDYAYVLIDQIPNYPLYCLYLKEDNFGMKKGEIIQIKKKSKTLSKQDQGNYIFLRQILNGTDLIRYDNEFKDLIIDSRDGSRKSLNQIFKERGSPIRRYITINRNGLKFTYYFKFADGPMQGGISALVFNNFLLPIDFKFVL